MMINNKNVQDLSINGKTVQSIKDLTTNKIIYNRTEDTPTPIVYNPSFSFNNEGYIIGSDLDPNYYYIIVQRDESVLEVISSDNPVTNIDFNLYDADIYYCNSSDIDGVSNEYMNSGLSFKDFAENATDVLFYYGSLKDMIRVNSVSSSTINITLHNFYDGNGRYSCNAVDSNGTGLIGGNSSIHSDPISVNFLFSGGKSGKVVSNPVSIKLYDSSMNVLQTKIVNME